MGDEYDYDADDGMGYDYDDNWMYVEDEYGLADELAEGQIADPGYTGTQSEIEMESYDYDLYDYWDDLEYADDAYWDYDAKPPPSANAVAEKPGQKRKRGVPAAPAGKRRKVSATHRVMGSDSSREGSENVVYRSQAERFRMFTAFGPVLKKGQPFALVPDWKTRYANMDGPLRVKAMPADMRKAAEAKEEDTPPKLRQVDLNGSLGDDEEGEEWEDENEDGECGEEGELAGIDPEMLKAVLKQRLGEAGLDGVDEGAFMSSLSKMLSGQGGDDEATGELANMLLGRATQDGDGALSGWLSQQGVSLEDGDEDEDASSVGTADPPGPPGRTRKHGAQVSPPDSAISGLSTQIPLHSGSPKARQKKKSPKSVRFDVPDGGELSAEEQGDSDPLPTPPTSQDPPDEDTSVTAIAAQARDTKAASTTAARSNHANGLQASPDVQLQQELDVEAAAEPCVAQQKQTRKRKALDEGAVVDGHGVDVIDGGKRAVKEPATRRTRSARAKAGK